MLIDVHSHFCPLPYLDEVEHRRNCPYPPRIERLLARDPAMTDPEVRLGAMDRHGIQQAVLSLAAPNVWPWGPEEAARMCRLANDSLVSVRERYPGRFSALGTLPLEDPREAPKELRRVMLSLGMPGAMIGANIRGRLLDEPVFTEFWETANELGAAIFLHPADFFSIPSLGDFGLMSLLGYIFDTTLAAARLSLAGHLERYLRVKLVLPHLGGTIPFVLDRLDRGYASREETRRAAPHPPSHYLKRIYYDTVSFHPPALRAALDTVGPARLLLGSDAPHPIGGMGETVRAIRDLGLPPEEEAAILGGNARKLFQGDTAAQ